MILPCHFFLYADELNQEVDQLVEKAIDLKTKGQIDDALSLIQKALQINENHLRARVHLGTLLMEKNRFEEAIIELDKSLNLDPKTPLAHYALSVCYVRKKTPNLILARQHLNLAEMNGYHVVPAFKSQLERMERGEIPPPKN